jgi:hypothetical protein
VPRPASGGPAAEEYRPGTADDTPPGAWHSDYVRIPGESDQRDLSAAVGLLHAASRGQVRLAGDAILGLLSPAWQALLALSLLVVTLLGMRRLAVRGPARVTNAVFFTGFLIVAVTVVGTLVVSCSSQVGQRSTAELRSPAP